MSHCIAALCRLHFDNAHILEQSLNERIVLAKQLEQLIRTADHLAMGLTDFQASQALDQQEDDEEAGG